MCPGRRARSRDAGGGQQPPLVVYGAAAALLPSNQQASGTAAAKAAPPAAAGVLPCACCTSPPRIAAHRPQRTEPLQGHTPRLAPPAGSCGRAGLSAHRLAVAAEARARLPRPARAFNMPGEPGERPYPPQAQPAQRPATPTPNCRILKKSAARGAGDSGTLPCRAQSIHYAESTPRTRLPPITGVAAASQWCGGSDAHAARQQVTNSNAAKGTQRRTWHMQAVI